MQCCRDRYYLLATHHSQTGDHLLGRGPNNQRLVEVWNSLPGVKPLTKFTNRKVATGRIWKAIQGLGDIAAAAPAPEPRVGAMKAKPVPERIETKPVIDAVTAEPATVIATVGAQSPHVAPTVATPGSRPTRSKKLPKNEPKPKGTREDSKAAQVVAMLQRKDGATLTEIMTAMGWQKHTVRGFMAGAMKKAGHAIESFKSDKGERTYRINSSLEPPPGPARRRRRSLSSSGRGVVEVSLPSSLASPADRPN
jgi:hypothetical protein